MVSRARIRPRFIVRLTIVVLGCIFVSISTGNSPNSALPRLEIVASRLRNSDEPFIVLPRFWSREKAIRAGEQAKTTQQQRKKEGVSTKRLSDDWLFKLHRSSNKKSNKSQGAQDYYLQTIFSRIGQTNRFFVEFGFNEANYTSGGSGANTWDLHDRGWRGLLLDGSRHNEQINLHAHYLFADNIASLFKHYSVPNELDYLSCDMDSHDLFVFDGILKAGFRPRVITTEFNSNYPLELAITQIDPTILGVSTEGYDFEFKECAWGASASALRLVAEKYGYTLIGRISRLDLVWIRNDLIEQFWEIPPFEWFFDKARLGALHHGIQTSEMIFQHIMDYSVYLHEGDINRARTAAREKLVKSQLPCFREISE